MEKKKKGFSKIGYTRRFLVTIGCCSVFGQSGGPTGSRTQDFQSAHEPVPENDGKSCGCNRFCTFPSKIRIWIRQQKLGDWSQATPLTLQYPDSGLIPCLGCAFPLTNLVPSCPRHLFVSWRSKALGFGRLASTTVDLNSWCIPQNHTDALHACEAQWADFSLTDHLELLPACLLHCFSASPLLCFSACLSICLPFHAAMFPLPESPRIPE